MNTIHLAPVRREPPTCDSYADEAAVRFFERAMRVHRAHVELASLGLQDIAVERPLAEEAVREASEWVARLTPDR